MGMVDGKAALLRETITATARATAYCRLPTNAITFEVREAAAYGRLPFCVISQRETELPAAAPAPGPVCHQRGLRQRSGRPRPKQQRAAAWPVRSSCRPARTPTCKGNPGCWLPTVHRPTSRTAISTVGD